MFKNIREYENLHILLWLVKDTCWALDFKEGGMLMFIPTITVAIHIVYRSRNKIHDLFHNIAICLWICANGTWMFGEFYYEDTLRPYALIFFTLGLIVVSVYYIFIFPKRKREQVTLGNE